MLSTNPTTDIHAEAARWAANRHNGEHDSGEHHAFMHWLNADPAHREAYERAEAIWTQLGGLEPVAGRQLAEARAFLAASQRRPARRVRAWAIAACVTAFACMTLWFADPFSYLNDQIYRTAQGEHRSFVLADGSRLDLNTTSEVRVHYSRRIREVRLLRGEIACDVTHESVRPFLVESGAARIRDIGTRFNVRQYPDRHIVSVLEGEVEVATDDVSAQRLHQGEQLGYDAAGKFSAIAQIDPASVSAWREGRIVFNGQPLKDVLTELGRYQPAQLTVSAPHLLDIKVSGAFSTGDLPQAFKTIAATLPVKVTQTGTQSWQLDAR